jgi:hypothetical protein
MPGKYVQWMQLCLIKVYLMLLYELTPWWRLLGGRRSKDSEIEFCSNIVHLPTENGLCIESLQWLLRVA